MNSAEFFALGTKSNDAEGHQTLENLAKDHLKISVKKNERDTGFYNINRGDARGLMG